MSRYTILVAISINLAGALPSMPQAKASSPLSPLCTYGSPRKCQINKYQRHDQYPNWLSGSTTLVSQARTGRQISNFPAIYEINIQRRAFLNLIRYLAGTWNAGGDDGYGPPRDAESTIIGAYNIYKKVYFDAGNELRIFPGHQEYYLRPEIQDQIALHLIAARGLLPIIDNQQLQAGSLTQAIKAVQDAMLISFSPQDERYSDTVSHEEMAIFWRSNLSHLKDLASKPTSLAARPWPDLICDAECQKKIIGNPLATPAPSPNHAEQRLHPNTSPGNSSHTSSNGSQSETRTFDQSLVELVRQGVVSMEEVRRIRSGAQPPSTLPSAIEMATGALRRPSPGRQSSSPQVKPLSERERALLRQIRAEKSPAWRLYGKCKYDWSNWKKLDHEVRSTTVDCGPSQVWTIGVSCKRLLINLYSAQLGWQGWTRPAGHDHETRAGEDEMVAALCANLANSR